MGFSSINAQGLTAPPFFLSFLITILSTYIADKTQQRGFMIMILSTIGFVGYVLLAACEVIGVRYFGVFLAASGIFPSIANILPWVLSKSNVSKVIYLQNLSLFANQTIKAPIHAVVLESSSLMLLVSVDRFLEPTSSHQTSRLVIERECGYPLLSRSSLRS